MTNEQSGTHAGSGLQAPQHILVTGASSGFGALTVRALARAGHIVFAGIRDTAGRNQPAVDELTEFAGGYGVDARAVDLDVTQDGSSERAVAEILDQVGHLDTIVHNVGHMTWGPTEAYGPDQMLALYDTNVVGAQRLNRAALPHLRARGSGLLVWIGSTSTHAGAAPYFGPYFATKAAADSLAVTYATELIKFGIDSALVIPGAYTSGTNHFAHATAPADDAVNAVYEETYGPLMEQFNKRLAEYLPADADVSKVADAVVDVVGMPFGTRPLRTYVDPSRDGADVVSTVADRIRAQYLYELGLGELLTAGSSR